MSNSSVPAPESPPIAAYSGAIGQESHTGNQRHNILQHGYYDYIPLTPLASSQRAVSDWMSGTLEPDSPGLSNPDVYLHEAPSVLRPTNSTHTADAVRTPNGHSEHPDQTPSSIDTQDTRTELDLSEPHSKQNRWVVNM
jgi:hypothetical protein